MINIGNQPFRTKETLSNYIRGLIKYYFIEGSEEAFLPAGSHFEFLTDLIAHHPDAESKFAKPIKAFGVGNDKTNTNQCFYVVFEDDTVDDFSWVKCIHSAPKYKASHFLKKRKYGKKTAQPVVSRLSQPAEPEWHG